MAEKEFTDKLNRLNYASGLTRATNFLQSGVIAFNHEVFLKAINIIYSEEVYNRRPVKVNQILKRFKKVVSVILLETTLFERVGILECTPGMGFRNRVYPCINI